MISIEDLRRGDEEAAHQLGRQAFNMTEPFDPDRPSMDARRHVAAYMDGALVGQVVRHRFGQYFGGRRLACAGISAVTVAPQARNRNVARRMLDESLQRATADGEVIAALYPTTAALYRSVGFEVAGWWLVRGVPVVELPSDDGSVKWQRANFGDSRARTVYAQMAPDHDGWLDPPDEFWTWRAMQSAGDTKSNRYLYIGVREGVPVAAVQYAYASSDRAMYRVDADAIYGIDGAALRSALAFLGSNGTTVDEIRTVLPDDELGLHLPHMQRTRVHQSWPWMLAIIDVCGAIAGRGYPQAVTGSVQLAVDDPHRQTNSGKWVFSISDGRASLEQGGDGHVALTITDLASLFSGYLDPLRLAQAGRLGEPDSNDIGLLRAAFAGTPSLTIFF